MPLNVPIAERARQGKSSAALLGFGSGSGRRHYTKAMSRVPGEDGGGIPHRTPLTQGYFSYNAPNLETLQAGATKPRCGRRRAGDGSRCAPAMTRRAASKARRAVRQGLAVMVRWGRSRPVQVWQGSLGMVRRVQACSGTVRPDKVWQARYGLARVEGQVRFGRQANNKDEQGGSHGCSHG